MQPTHNFGTVSPTFVEPEPVAQVEQSALVPEPGTQMENPAPNRIQRVLQAFLHRLRTPKLNKLICLAIGVLMLVQLALSLAVSNVLQEAHLKSMNRHKITATIIYWYLSSLFSHTFGLFCMWNQWFWCAVAYLVMLLINSSYVLFLLSCTVRSNCPATALFVAIPRLGSLVWVYWLVLAWLYVLIGLVAFYVTTSAFARFGCEDALSSSNSINWPEELPSFQNSRSGPEEMNLNPIPAAACSNFVVIKVISPSKDYDSSGMMSSLTPENEYPSLSNYHQHEQYEHDAGHQVSEYKHRLEY